MQGTLFSSWKHIACHFSVWLSWIPYTLQLSHWHPSIFFCSFFRVWIWYPEPVLLIFALCLPGFLHSSANVHHCSLTSPERAGSGSVSSRTAAMTTAPTDTRTSSCALPVAGEFLSPQLSSWLALGVKTKKPFGAHIIPKPAMMLTLHEKFI